MTTTITLSKPLTWQEVALVAQGARLDLAAETAERIVHGRKIVDALVKNEVKGYGINTGVGALCDVVIDKVRQSTLSHNILMSHACGVGEPLGREETRAIMVAQVNNFAHGASGVRIEIVDALIALLNQDCIPVVPGRGSVGYLSHAAHIGLVLTGHGYAIKDGVRISGAQACEQIGVSPIKLQAKEGLSLVNGTPCATGLSCIALARMAQLLDWADMGAAMSSENLGCQITAFSEAALDLRKSDGLKEVGRTLRSCLENSPMLSVNAGKRTQDPLSVRAVPHVHGAARDMFVQVGETLQRELESVTDNPTVSGTPDKPEVHSQAHAVGAALALSLDSLGIAAAEMAMISERRIDRLVNPMVSGLPAFLVPESGVCSGFMIAQYTAVSLVSENRRFASAASLDGGITSALQEDMLTHATPSALKLLSILGNLAMVLGIELLAAAQAYDLQAPEAPPAHKTGNIYRAIRKAIPAYRDDRPMHEDFDAILTFMKTYPINQELG